MNKKVISRNCPVCGIAYLADVGRLLHGRQTTCSRGCSYALRMKGRKDEVWLSCAVCGRQMVRSPSQVKGKYGCHFCSRECHYAGRSIGASQRVVTRPYTVTDAGRAAWKIGAQKTVAARRRGDNYRKSDEVRTKLSIATARSLAKRKPGVSSKLEDKVAAHLQSIGATFDRQFPFRDNSGRFAYVVDFWFPSVRTAIEVNGSYWHADPRVYPVLVNAMQEQCVAKYRRKLDSLARLGIRIVELWEFDFNREPEQAVFDAYTKATSG